MKFELSYDEVSAVAMALLSKAQEAEEEALGCESCAVLLPLSFGRKEPTFTERLSRQ